MSQYRVFRKLNTEEYTALENDIKERGVLIPIEVDERGNILDGFHRKEIAERLGVECPSIVRALTTEEEKQRHVRKINLCRRHCDALEWGRLFKAELAERGVKRGKGGDRKSAKSTATVAVDIASEYGVPARTARHRLKMADDFDRLKVEVPHLAEKVQQNEINIYEAQREHRAERKRVALEKAAASISEARRKSIQERCDLRQCSCRELFATGIKPDVVITDPPYSRECLPCFSELAEACRDIPLVAVMSGQIFLPEVFQRLCEHLTYRWTLCYQSPGAHSRIRQARIFQGWKPVLLFGKGDYIYDVIRSGKDLHEDKVFHELGQSEGGMAELVKALSKPGQLVCDPFLGGGTTAVVSLALGRRFVGCDIEASCIETARIRVEAQSQE